jgi:hypothetical protein
MSEQKEMICLLAAAVSELKQLRQQMRQQMRQPARPDSKKKESPTVNNPVADGMLAMFTGQKPIADEITPEDKKRLTVRARKALVRAGVTMRSEVTRERFDEVRNCGQTTIAELLEWAAR